MSIKKEDILDYENLNLSEDTMPFIIKYILKQLLSLESSIEEIRDNIQTVEHFLSKKDDSLEERLIDLENSFHATKVVNNISLPFKCPVCDADPDYRMHMVYSCIACKGKGIVWG